MITKNKALLRRRVNSNVREDKLVNNAYIERTGKRKKKAQVCGIGCLAIPHTIKDRIEFYKLPDPEFGDSWKLYQNESSLINELRTEFGICHKLARLLEVLFMAANRPKNWTGGNNRVNPKRAGEFLKEFANRIPEGVDINDSHVEAFCNKVGLVGDIEDWESDAADAHANYDKYVAQLFAWFDNGCRVRGLTV